MYCIKWQMCVRNVILTPTCLISDFATLFSIFTKWFTHSIEVSTLVLLLILNRMKRTPCMTATALSLFLAAPCTIDVLLSNGLTSLRNKLEMALRRCSDSWEIMEQNNSPICFLLLPNTVESSASLLRLTGVSLTHHWQVSILHVIDRSSVIFDDW